MTAMMAFATLAAAGLVTPQFSFRYEGKEYRGTESMLVEDRLKVSLEKTEYPELDAVWWRLVFENPCEWTSGVVSDIRDGDFTVPLPPDEVRYAGDASKPGDRAVVAMRGCVGEGTWDYSFDDESSATEFAPKCHYLRKQTWSDKITIENRNARSSNVMAPFFNVNSRDEGALVAIGWTGGWRAHFENEPGGVKVVTGLKKTAFRLKGGEKIRTTSVLVMRYANGEDASNKFRKLVRTQFSHRAKSGGRDREGLFAFELWGATKSSVMIDRIRKLAAEKVCPELMWVDAGWYGNVETGADWATCDWPSQCGDWVMNRGLHPNGMVDVAEEARKHGMAFMLWFTPECIGKKAEAKKAHPEWILDPPGVGYALWDYGQPAAWQSTFETLCRYVDALHLTCYRQDFNQGLDKHFALADARNPDRIGVAEIRHIEGMYRLWDELRKRYPQLLIDNCASGGRRIDIETLRRSIPFFRSDFQCTWNYTPEVVQAHNANISWWLPYTGCTTKQKDLYALRSSYSSSWGFAAFETGGKELTEGEYATLRKACADYLRIRRYFSLDFYNHGSHCLDLSSWAVWQYGDPEKGEGVVLAFRRPESPCDGMSIPLKGLPAGARIEVEDIDSGEKSTVSDGTLVLRLPERRSSAILLYRTKGAKR